MRRFLYTVYPLAAASTLLQHRTSDSNMSLSSQLHDAIFDGNEHLVERLLQNGADVNAVRNRELPFTRAMDLSNNKISEMLLGHRNFNPNSRNQLDRTPIFYAAKFNNVSMVKKLKGFGCDIDASDIRGVTPLGATAWDDAVQSADLLIQYGADVNKADVRGETALHRACSNVSINIVRLLLSRGSCVNSQTNEQKLAPLMEAIPSSYKLDIRGKSLTDMIDIVKLLLSKNCDLNLTDKNGDTALHQAVDVNEFHCACLLMEHGCDLNIRNNNGLSPLHLAISPDRPRYELALCLLYYGCDANLRISDPKTGENILPIQFVLHTNTKNPQDERLRQKLIDALLMATDFSNYDITCLKEDNQSTGDNSSEKNQSKDVWPFTLQHQCRLVIRLALASDILLKIDRLPVGLCLKHLLALNCDYKRRHPLTTAELHTAITDNNTSAVQTILHTHQIDVYSPLNNKTPLTLAAERGHIDSAVLLLQHGAEVTELDPNGQSSMHVAAAKGHSELLQVLMIDRDVNIVNSEGRTPLWLAVSEGKFDCAVLLSSKGADQNLIRGGDIPALHFAAGSGHSIATSTFLQHGADVTALDSNGNTALHVAASRGIIYLRNNIRLPAVYKNKTAEIMDAVKMTLLDCNPRYTDTDPDDYVSIIQCLLDRGCDPTIVNQDGKTVLDISREFGLHEANRIIQEWINKHSG